jgi:hypothetical protein
MPRKSKPVKLLERLIDETFRSYIAAVKNRTFLLEMGYTGLNAGRWNEKAQAAIRYGAILSRVCGGISQELQNLYAIEERLRQNAEKGLHIVIEHVESPWQPEYSQSADRVNTNTVHECTPTPPQSSDIGQKEVSP